MRFVLPLLLVGSLLTPTTFSRSLQDQNEPQDPTQGEQDAPVEGEQPAEPQFTSQLDVFERGLGLKFQRGGEGQLGTRATIDVPEGFVFADGDVTRKILEAFENIPNGSELGLFAPEAFDWFVVFDYSEEGYVKDDEKDDLDADDILATLRESTARGNEARRARGLEEFELEGWAVPPKYNETTHNLEWATRIRAKSGTSVNHRTKILGRKGVMEVVLVCSPEQLETLLPEYRRHMDSFAYVSGEKYSEYTSGDKLAAYGLTALVAGGAGVLAAKTGLLAKFWKLIVAAVVAVGAGVKKLFGGKSKSDSATS